MAKGSSSPSGLFGSPPPPHLLIGVTKTGADQKWEGWASIHPTPISIHPPPQEGYTRCLQRPLLTMSEAQAISNDGIQNAYSGGNTHRDRPAEPRGVQQSHDGISSGCSQHLQTRWLKCHCWLLLRLSVGMTPRPRKTPQIRRPMVALGTRS